MATDLELIYVADPMCSWCWGFAPVIEKVEASSGIHLRIIVGGLRPGRQAERLEHIRDYVGHHWKQVAAVSGQPFDIAGLDRDDWVYDTMVADTAVVTMRQIAPDETRRFLDTVQRAFYANRVDVTDTLVYRDLVEGFPVDRGKFVTQLESSEMQALAEQDFLEAKWLGVTGFPTLLLRDGSSTMPISLGYAPFDTVADRINSLVEKMHPDAAAGLLCDIDGELC